MAKATEAEVIGVLQHALKVLALTPIGQNRIAVAKIVLDQAAGLVTAVSDEVQQYRDNGLI